MGIKRAVDDAEFEKRDIRKFGDCKSEVAMRPSDKVNGREFSLSYGKLVRSTAIQANAEKVENTLESVTEYVTGLKLRVFQNLIFTIGMDDMESQCKAWSATK